MTARIPQSVREEQLNALPNMRFVRWLDGYENSDSRAVMRCHKNHEWSAVINNLLNNGSGCPMCAGQYRYSPDERVRQLNSVSNMRFLKWVDGYRNKESKAVMQCDNGHEWTARTHDLVNGKSSCPKCSGKHIYSKQECEQTLNSLPNVRFVGWENGYRNKNSKAIMCCNLDANVWSATVDRLRNGRSGCPKCARVYRYSAEERELQLNSLPSKTFVRWLDGYHNCESRAVMRCGAGHEWDATVDSLVNGGRECPACAKYGFDPTKPGTLYALRSECGKFIKIGISNKFERRLKELRRATPFQFHVVAKFYSNGEAIRHFEKLFHSEFKSSGHEDFDGATEWLQFKPDILALMRALGA